MAIKAIVFDVGNTLIRQVDESQGRLDEQKLLTLPDAINTFARAKKHYQVCILSNTDATEDAHMRKALTGIGFDLDDVVLVTSLSFGQKKPAPGIFWAIANKLGCEAQEIVMVGDNPVEDMEGAAAVGWQTIQVKTGPNSDIRSRYSVELLPEIFKKIADINRP